VNHVVDVRYPARVAFEHRHLRAHAGGHLRRMRPYDSGADNGDVGRSNAGYAAEKRAFPPRRLLEVERAFLDRHPARDLAHRGQEGQIAIRELHRFVRDRDGSRLEQRARELGRGREVDVREQDLPRAKV